MDNKKPDYSKFKLFTWQTGLTLTTDITFDQDGDVILLVSAYDGKNVGCIKLSKSDKEILKEYLK
mgnify:CR=1 FL=1